MPEKQLLPLIRRYDNFGDKSQIVKALELLKTTASIPLQDFIDIGIPASTLRALEALTVVAIEEDRASLPEKISSPDIPRILVEKLFQTLKAENLLHDFLRDRSLYLDKQSSHIYVRNSAIPLDYSGIRNLLVNLEFFLRDELNSAEFSIHPSYQEWFLKSVIPDIKESTLAGKSPEQLKRQQDLQEKMGREAEEFVLQYEREQRKHHRNVGDIKIISDIDTAAGYDILSYSSDDALLPDKFIEVKSFSGTPSFYWSANEVRVAKEKGEQYFLYLVDRDAMQNEGYQPMQITNPAEKLLDNPSWRCQIDGYVLSKID